MKKLKFNKIKFKFKFNTSNLRMLNKPIISLQPFQQKKSHSDDRFFGRVYTKLIELHKQLFYLRVLPIPLWIRNKSGLTRNWLKCAENSQNRNNTSWDMNYFSPFWSSPDRVQTDRLHTESDAALCAFKPWKVRKIFDNVGWNLTLKH